MVALQPGLTPLRRWVGAALVVLLLIGAVLYFRASNNGTPVAASNATTRSSPSPSSAMPVTPTTTPSGTPAQASTPGTGGENGSPPADLGQIEVYGKRVTTAEPNETVRFRGTYHGAPETFLRLELRNGAKWVAHPYQTKTDWLGRFITHVEIAEPGPHWLRVVDPGADRASEPFVLVIEED